MQKRKWLVALMALTATGLIAAGCGDDDEDTTATTPAATTTSETTTEDTTAGDTTTEDTSTEGSTPEDVYQACLDVIEGTAAEEAGQTGCEQARDAFATCAEEAEAVGDETARETALALCQDAADATVEALEQSG